MPITTRARALAQAIEDGGEGVWRHTNSVEEAQGSVVYEGGEVLMGMMSDLGLFAASTAHQPPRHSGLGSATYVSKLAHGKPRQLDYVLISSRFRSNVLGTKMRWGPSHHRCNEIPVVAGTRRLL